MPSLGADWDGDTASDAALAWSLSQNFLNQPTEVPVRNAGMGSKGLAMITDAMITDAKG